MVTVVTMAQSRSAVGAAGLQSVQAGDRRRLLGVKLLAEGWRLVSSTPATDTYSYRGRLCTVAVRS